MGADSELAEAFVTASRALLGLAVRSLEAAHVEVTLAQHRVLVILAARGTQTIGEIAGELDVNPSNATRYCDRLQRLGLLSRTRSAADGRVVRVELTAQGQGLVRAVNRRRHEDIERVLGQISSAEAVGVVDALKAFNRAAAEVDDREWVLSPW